MKTTKIFIFLFILLIYGDLKAADNDFLNLSQKKQEKTIKLFDKDLKSNSFSVKAEYIKRYNEIQKLLDYGFIIEAEKKANKFYSDISYLNNDNLILKHMANILLGRTYKEKGDIFEWKYLEAPTMKFVLKYNSNKLGINYLFFIVDINDIILAEKSKNIANEIIHNTYKVLIDNRDKIEKSKYYQLQYKIFNFFYKYNIKYFNSPKREEEFFSKVENAITRYYSYYSIEEARLNLDKANFYLNKKGDTEKSFLAIKNALNIIDNLFKNKKIKNIKDSIFVAELYFYIGEIYSNGTKIKKSIQYYKKSEDIYLRNKIYKKVLENESKESIGYKILKKYDKALNINKKEIELAKKMFGKKSEEYAIALLLKSDILSDINKYKESLEVIKEARDIYIKKYGRFSKEVKIINSNLRFLKLKNSEF